MESSRDRVIILWQFRSALTVILMLTVSVFLASCNLSKKNKQSNTDHINTETKFSSDEYGVDGSPRVTTSKQVPKGGGYYKIGKPYTIRGKTYYPHLDPNYNKSGFASWYGPNFHGRMTANGEIYDQYALTAAHPTMPLPSYAKVTNLENGSSIVVRVNDRGPYAHNRIIDLSAQAANMLGYKRNGIAKVRVEYVGKARMDGLDAEFLMASYKPNGLNSDWLVAPGSNQIQIAQDLSGRLPLDQMSTYSISSGIAVPVPTSRPATNYGIPLFEGTVAVGDTSSLLSGYVAETSRHMQTDQPFKHFDFSGHSATLNEPLRGMNDIARIRFGAFSTEGEIQRAESILLKYGDVSRFGDDLVLLTAKEDAASILEKLSKDSLKIRK